MLKALESNQNKAINIVKEITLPSNNDILEDFPVVLHCVDPRRKDHSPFYVSLLVDNLLFHNCMLDSGTSSNVITRKVME